MSKKKKRNTGSAPQETKPVAPKKAVAFSPHPFAIREHQVPLFLVAALAIGLYLQSVGFDYVLDDKMVIVDNRFTQQGISGIPDIFKYESFRGFFGEQTEYLEGDRYRPLSIASFALEKSLLGGNKAISHFINILLYALTGLLLYRVLFFMFPGTGPGGWKKQLFSLPFVAAALYIAHPLHVEVVANIKGRDEILAFMGELGTLYFSFRYLADKKKRQLLFSFLCFWAAILSKEGAITFLAVVPLTMYFFTKAGKGEMLRTTLPVLAGTLLYLVMRTNAIGYLLDDKEVTDLMNNPFYGLGFGDKMATIFYTLLLYLKLQIYPHPLTHDYYPWHIPVMSWSQWQPIVSLLLHAALIGVIIKGWKNKTAWSWSAAYYLITLSIVSNIAVSVGIFMNERFVYHASLGFCVALAWLLTHTMNRNKLLRTAAIALFILFVAGYSLRTLVRLPDWQSNLALDRSALKYSPNSARSNCFYGIDIWQEVYLKLPQDADPSRKRAVLDSIKPYLEKSVQILPSYKAAQSMRAGLAGEYYKLDNNLAELLRVFEEVNRSGAYEKYVTDFLLYLNSAVSRRADAENLAGFYARMIDYYTVNFPGTTLVQDYRNMLEAIRQRIPSLN